jgi:chaperonin GroEL
MSKKVKEQQRDRPGRHHLRQQRPEIGKIIADAMDKVGKDGVITVEEGKTPRPRSNVVEGMQFDKGFSPRTSSPTREHGSRARRRLHPDPREEDLSSCRTCSRCWRRSPRAGKPLLIIAEEVEGEALATLVVNKLRGTLNVCAVKAPASATAARPCSRTSRSSPAASASPRTSASSSRTSTSATSARPKRITVDKENTTIVEGAGQVVRHPGPREADPPPDRRDHSDYDREKLQERLAKLAGGVAVINVGAATETEMKEKKARVEDALHATRAAVEEGIVPGGGVALLRPRSPAPRCKMPRRWRVCC